MMRRNIVPQPLLVLGVSGRRIGFPFVDRRVGQLVAEDLVNYVARRLRRRSHCRPPV
jgi:hypothetical protein